MSPSFIRRAVGGAALTVLVPAASAFAQSTVSVSVPGYADPYLAGMPAGSTASSGDVAPAQSPLLVSGFTVVPGGLLQFAASGSVYCGAGCVTGGPDGVAGDVFTHRGGAENGIANVSMPATALLGVFLDANAPILSSAPGALDFTAPLSRDYLSLSPGLKQVFFIGDGLTSGGASQQIVVPARATRLFLGTMDGYGWYNNTGAFSVTITRAGVPTVAPEPTTAALLIAGLAGTCLTLRAGRRRGAPVPGPLRRRPRSSRRSASVEGAANVAVSR